MALDKTTYNNHEMLTFDKKGFPDLQTTTEGRQVLNIRFKNYHNINQTFFIVWLTQ